METDITKLSIIDGQPPAPGLYIQRATQRYELWAENAGGQLFVHGWVNCNEPQNPQEFVDRWIGRVNVLDEAVK